jgi:hypothetical protein
MMESIIGPAQIRRIKESAQLSALTKEEHSSNRIRTEQRKVQKREFF